MYYLPYFNLLYKLFLKEQKDSGIYNFYKKDYCLIQFI